MPVAALKLPVMPFWLVKLSASPELKLLLTFIVAVLRFVWPAVAVMPASTVAAVPPIE